MQTTETLYADVLACAFFNKVFLAEPTEQTLALLARDGLFEDWPAPAEADASRRGLDALRAFFRDSGAQCIDNVRLDHAGLFEGPTGAVPVWESVWTTKDGLLYDESTLDVRAFYARHGLQVERRDRGPDDHIGYEFAFLGHLLASAMQAECDGDRQAALESLDAARCFLELHLGRWGPSCLGQMAEQARTGFYRGAALLGLGYLEELGGRLGGLEAA